MQNYIFHFRDHLCHLYGPAVLYEPTGKGKDILGSVEDFFDIQRDDDDDDNDANMDSDGGGAAVGLSTPQRKFSVASSGTDPSCIRAPPPPNVISPTSDVNTTEVPTSAPHHSHSLPPSQKRSFSIRASFRSRQRAVTLPKSGTREERQYLRQTLRRNPYK